MLATIEKSSANGTVYAPPSKSMAHRLLICAALSMDTSTIKNVDYSEDILATIDCLRAIGAKITVDGNMVTVVGVDPKNISTETEVFCRESGSTLRFILPILLLANKKCTLKGSNYLLKRPMSVYSEICNKKCLYYHHENDRITVCGPLTAGKFTIKGDISSQFISGLLFTLPLLENDSTINILPPVESRSYINMTIDALQTFGVTVMWRSADTLYIKGNQKYVSKTVSVEGDYSNAAFYEAFNRIGGDIKICGLKNDSLQGDKVCFTLFDVLETDSPIIDVSDCPDLAPIIITVAAMKNGATLKGTKRLKMKESDRGVVMAAELKKFGADITVFEDEIVINKKLLFTPTAQLDGHNDHRVVMSLAVISSVFCGEILGAQAVSKSFPDFFEKIKLLGIRVMLNEDK